MQKFPEDDLTKRRRAMMSSETVMDYKAKMDEARRVELARPPDVVEAERMAALYEELKETTKKYFDMGGRPPMMIAPGEREFMFQHFIDRRRRPYSYHHDEGHCPMCAAEKRSANFQKIPKTLIGVDLATKPSQMVGFDYSGTELKIAAQMDEAAKEEVDRTFMDLLEGCLPAGAGPWPPPQPDPMYKIEGTRRNMHDDFVRRMQRELRSDMPFMRVTSTDPTKSKADVWAAVKKFLDSRHDKTAVPVLPSDIKIEPLTPDVLRDGFRHLDRERPRDCWEKAREALSRLPGDTPLFYNEVLGEYGPQHVPGPVDALYREGVRQIQKERYNAKSVSFTERGIRGHRIDFAAIDEVQTHQELGVLAQKLYAEGKISRETMLKFTEVKDESGSGEPVREPEGKGRDEEV